MHIVRNRNGLPAALVAAWALACPAGVSAQGLEDPAAIDTIISSDVKEEETSAAADPARVIAAIEKSGETVSAVRKASALDRIDIVYLADATVTEGGPPAEVKAKVDEFGAEIADLRKEIEGNAMLYHALDSRQILPRDVLALEFADERSVVIFAAAKPAGQ